MISDEGRPQTPCLEWEGWKDKKGYGLGYRGGKMVRAARRAWEEASGSPMPVGNIACHTCDNPGCVRNDEAGIYMVEGTAYPRFGHLWLGTHKANMADMRLKRRQAVGIRHGFSVHPERAASGVRNGHVTHPEKTPRGEAVNLAKLNASEVAAIRAAYGAGEGGTRKLARVFGISRGAVQKIVTGRTWRHLLEPPAIELEPQP